MLRDSGVGIQRQRVCVAYDYECEVIVLGPHN